MALIVEDGTGLATADSYISLADAETYITKWALIGRSWPDSYSADAQKEDALRAAARLMDLIYRVRFVSRRRNETQALEWPRNGWITRDFFHITNSTIPVHVQEAQVEMALIIAEGGGNVLVPDTVGEQVDFERNESDQSMKTVRYATPLKMDSAGNVIKQYPMVEKILSPVLHKPGRLDRR